MSNSIINNNVLSKINQKKHFTIALLLLTVFTILFLAPNIGFAQDYSIDSSDIQVSQSDESKTLLLNPLLGDSFDGSVESINSPLSKMVLAFNGAVLFLAGLYAIYTIILSMVNTAHDGTLLGQRMESHWLPIRTMLGSSLLLPVFKGFAAIQILVIWLTMQSIGLANYVNKQAIEMDSVMVSNFNPQSSYSNVRDLAQYMFISNVCAISQNTYAGKQDPSFFEKTLDFATFGNYTEDSLKRGEVRFNKIYSEDVGADVSGYNVDMGWHDDSDSVSDNNGALQNQASTPCGAVRYHFTATFDAENSTGQESNGTQTNSSVASLTQITQGATEIKQRLDSKSLQLTRNLFDSTESLAESYMNNNETTASINEKLNSYALYYVRYMAQAGRNEYNNNSTMRQVRENIANDGALFAGFYALKIISLQNTINESVINSATGTINIGESKPSGFKDKIYNGLIADLTNSRTSPSAISDPSFNDDGNSLQVKDINMDDGSWSEKLGGLMEKLTTAAISSITGISGENIGANISGAIIGALVDKDDHLLITMNNLAQFCRNVALTLFGTAAAASATYLGTGFGAGTSMFLYGIGTTMVSLFGIFFMAQLVIPFMWLSFILTYSIGIYTAIFGAPLMALALLAPMSEGLIGKGRQGLLSLGSLLLAFPITVVGVYLTLIVIGAFGSFLNEIFVSIFKQGGIGGDFFGMIFIIVSYFSVALVIIRTTARLLISDFAAKIFDWIGEGAPNLLSSSDQVSQGMTEQTERGKQMSDNMTKQSVQGAAGFMNKGLGKANKGMGMDLKGKKEQNEKYQQELGQEKQQRQIKSQVDKDDGN